MLDCHKCLPNAIRNKLLIDEFTRRLVRRIDMIPHGPPQIIHFGSGNKAGYTMVQLIETSNICAHFVEETNDIYLDVFSCKEFSPQQVKDMVDSYFKPQMFRPNFVIRQAGPLIENGRSLNIPRMQ
jgi:S-adenosylmethionine/arginine decarboxylase-like enzyme